MIIAKRLKLINKNGLTEDYTHVTHIETVDDIKTPYLMISGEVDDVAGGRVNTHDKHYISDINITIIEWYISPK